MRRLERPPPHLPPLDDGSRERQRKLDNQIRLLPLVFYVIGAGMMLKGYIEVKDDRTYAALIVCGGLVMLAAMGYDKRCKEREKSH